VVQSPLPVRRGPIGSLYSLPAEVGHCGIRSQVFASSTEKSWSAWLRFIPLAAYSLLEGLRCVCILKAQNRFDLSTPTLSLAMWSDG
jgi:hypothetical protein